MNCLEIQQDIALLAGHDLAPNEERLVKEHIAQCPDCRKTQSKLEDSQTILRTAREVPEELTGNSLWPRVRAQMPQKYAPQSGREQFRWLPTATMAAACVALVVFAGSSPMFSVDDQPFVQNDSNYDVIQNVSSGLSAPSNRMIQPVADPMFPSQAPMPLVDQSGRRLNPQLRLRVTPRYYSSPEL